jgi:hypothetical protein
MAWQRQLFGQVGISHDRAGMSQKAEDLLGE